MAGQARTGRRVNNRILTSQGLASKSFLRGGLESSIALFRRWSQRYGLIVRLVNLVKIGLKGLVFLDWVEN